jgi:WD40 repeat protein
MCRTLLSAGLLLLGASAVSAQVLETHPTKPTIFATNNDAYVNNKVQKPDTKNIYVNMKAGKADYTTMKGHTDDVIAIAWAGDGKKLISGSEDNTAVLWDVVKGKQLFAMKHDEPVKLVCFTKDGKQVVTATCNAGKTLNTKLEENGEVDGSVQFWDAITGVKKATIDAKVDGVTAMRVLPAIDCILIAGKDKTLTMWSLGKREKLQTWKLKSPVMQLLAHPTGKKAYALCTEDKVIRSYDLEEKMELTGITLSKTPMEELTLSANGNYLISIEKNTDLEPGLDKKKVDGAANRIVMDLMTFGLAEIFFSASDVNNRPVHVWSTKSNKLIKSGSYGDLKAILSK